MRWQGLMDECPCNGLSWIFGSMLAFGAGNWSISVCIGAEEPYDLLDGTQKDAPIVKKYLDFNLGFPPTSHWRLSASSSASPRGLLR